MHALVPSPPSPGAAGALAFTRTALLLVRRYGISRKDMEEFAVASHAKAVAATKAGRFKREIGAMA